ncbi:hypothetical protein [Alteromonas confluentis]|uniref:Uncharacterized protein n=1 Tax=Alteromonas confluentis TaxID=1656094 RepID=A0A1E7ZE52_9ALTE|nr:hypothetical protein [Alteromonas confluentis]OFC71793.1 hypothetical protein BFC18_06465 [Alteromonas confluentis]
MLELDYHPFRPPTARKEKKSDAIRDLNNRRMTEEQKAARANRRKREDILLARELGIDVSDFT